MKLKLKTIFFFVALLSGAITSNAQINTGDLYQGMSRTIPNGRVVLPYGLSVAYEKTVHLIFPSQIRYVDLGSSNIIAGKAEDADNVLRVKAAVRDFETETNLSVICNDGSFFSFNVKYAEEPERLNIEMQDFLYSGVNNLPTNKADIYFKELGNESPVLVKLIMKTIWQNDRREINHIGSKKFGLQFLLRGLYSNNGLLYFHTLIKNQNQMPYQVDFVTFKVVDKKVAKRTAIQEQVLQPLRSFNEVTRIGGYQTQRSVFVLEQFTLPDDKQLEVTLFEQNGGRHQTFVVENEDLIRAKDIDNLKLKF
ncbi:conjugative transposon protein TraN [Proteiniphilum propionicum]|uniref:conjugative transposon protein TraN n=1 Tax=Proteiniphilum propionicum TaxID=2829812 RepID=UPI001EEA9A2F|nr:conjugative transposon protein TraN [Proteiniphilum propionicum]ULB34333.1 conjugative transposon protein TraN [Proteiniphilum propionicum]